LHGDSVIGVHGRLLFIVSALHGDSVIGVHGRLLFIVSAVSLGG